MPYRLDKTAFRRLSFLEADQNTGYWRTKSVVERLAAAWYLIATAWGFDPDNPPPMDKTVFSCRKRA